MFWRVKADRDSRSPETRVATNMIEVVCELMTVTGRGVSLATVALILPTPDLCQRGERVSRQE